MPESVSIWSYIFGMSVLSGPSKLKQLYLIRISVVEIRNKPLTSLVFSDSDHNRCTQRHKDVFAYLQVLLFCITSALWYPDNLQKPSLL